MSVSNPAELRPHDPGWRATAERMLRELAVALRPLPGGAHARFDHIGSTAVPGLAAKPFIDLQVRIMPLPTDAALTARLAPLGFMRSRGSRPDSPGVSRDIPRGSADVPGEVWQKSLFVCESPAAILHVRRSDSPWGLYTVWFRDWLRAHPEQRERYEAVKRELSRREAGKADYDDYTLAKTSFFDAVQQSFEAWARGGSRQGNTSPG